MSTPDHNADRDVDIVLVILDLVRKTAPAVTPEQSLDIERAVRVKYGGLRARIAKRKNHKTPEQREQVVREALAESQANVSTDKIAESNGISRRTLYRLLKRGR